MNSKHLNNRFLLLELGDLIADKVAVADDTAETAAPTAAPTAAAKRDSTVEDGCEDVGDGCEIEWTLVGDPIDIALDGDDDEEEERCEPKVVVTSSV